MEQATFLKINPADSVVVCLQPKQKGDIIEIDGKKITVNQDTPAGHKVLIKDAPQGTTAEKAAVVLERIQALLDAANRCGRTVVFVSNEVGSGIVPDNAMAREYRDISGWVNQQIGDAAGRVFYVVAGQAVDIKRFAFRFE